jgi:siroheme synthase-like protein
MPEAPGPLIPYYPVSLNVAGRPCLIVGGGPVAARKARTLLGCDASVTVIAPGICAEMASLSPLTLERRPYASGDAAAYRLVVTATGIPEVDGAVYADADAAGVWVNSADDRAHCSFILPAVHRDGAVTIAVSTGGSAPALATWLRTRLAELGGDGLGPLAQLIGEARERLHTDGRSTESVDWAGVLNGPLPALVRDGRLEEARAILSAATGKEFQN